MSYCLNPSCPKPINHPKAKLCKACGSKLLLRNRYHLVKGLGKGGFGATFLAADLSLPGKPLCVIKQLRPNTDNPNFLSMARELFEREAKTLGRVGNHPQIPRLLDYFEDREQFYLVQEFVKGNNLQQEIKKQGVLDETQARQVLKEVLIILKDIHAQKVIHRDIKPANIIRREIDNKLVLIDFGVVKNQVNTIAAGNSNQTAFTAFAVGTPGFAPPEQLAMRPVYASDIYALGVTCMYLMTGKAPKNMDCDPITGEIDWFKYIKVGDSFKEIMSTMLEVAVKNRYKTADEVLGVLDMENHVDSLAESMIGYSPLEENKHTAARRTMSSGSKTTQSRMSPGIGSRTTVSRTSSIFSSPKTAASTGGNRTLSGRSKAYSGSKKFANTDDNPKEIQKPVKMDNSTLLSYYSKGRRDFGLKDLSMQDLEKATLSDSKFHHSRLIKVNLKNADLSGSDFSNSDLRQGIFRNANFNRAFFNAANLEGADLRGADLSYTSFEAAKLKGTNLCGANLTNSTVTKEQLETAKTNWLTILPNGKRGFW
ncbi:MAG: pentapeptide repeat-containing protein [Pleurocapsa sp.]